MAGGFICEFCDKVFTLNTNLRRHVRLHHDGPSSSFKCQTCNLHFSDRKEWHRHTHSNTKGDDNDKETNIYCEGCEKYIKKTNWHYHIRSNAHKLNCAGKADNNSDVKCIKSSFNNRIVTFLIENNNKNNLIPENFLTEIREKLIKLLTDTMQKHGNIKFNMELYGEYVLIKEGEDSCMVDIKSHQTKMNILTLLSTRDDILNIYNEQCNIIIKKMSEFQERDSGWALIEITRLEMNINQYKCIKGSQYLPLPAKIIQKKACVNVQNRDEYCFKWAIISALYPVDRDYTKRCSSYKINNIEDDIILLDNGIDLNFTNLNFPLPINQIKDFETMNPEISVNVFGLEDDVVVGPYYFTKEEKSKHINLMLLEDGERFHYVWIKNISRYVNNIYKLFI